MSALADDVPQFREVTGVDLEQAHEVYRRVWGEDPPTVVQVDHDVEAGDA